MGIITRPATNEYRDGFDVVFNKPKGAVDAAPLEQVYNWPDQREIYPQWFTSCFDYSPPHGWAQIVSDLCASIAATLANEAHASIHVLQVKEKFGGLRFYFSSENMSVDTEDRIYRLITAAEGDSVKTCQDCAQSGKLRDDLGWIRTLCDECCKEYK